jgi:hypothetical protein
MNKEPLRIRIARWLLRNSPESDHGATIGSANSIKLSSPRTRPSMDRMEDTISFTVHPASGGYVVESSFYDEKTDRHKRALHIITSQEDFSEELGKAVFMDMLRNR